MRQINSRQEKNQFIRNNSLALLYLSGPECNVCVALLPKINEMLIKFPRLKGAYINMNTLPELAGELSIFTIPVVIFYIDGKEILRQARFISIQELETSIGRFYEMIVE